MRTVFIILILITTFSCNKTEKPTQQVVNEITEIKEVVERPLFKDTIVNNYLAEYENYIDKYLNAITSKDTRTIKKLKENSSLLVEEAKIVSLRITTPEMLEKYKHWINYQEKRIKLINIK